MFANACYALSMDVCLKRGALPKNHAAQLAYQPATCGYIRQPLCQQIAAAYRGFQCAEFTCVFISVALPIYPQIAPDMPHVQQYRIREGSSDFCSTFACCCHRSSGTSLLSTTNLARQNTSDPTLERHSVTCEIRREAVVAAGYVPTLSLIWVCCL